MRNKYRIQHDPDSKQWLVNKDGASRAIGRFETKEQAENRGREVARNNQNSQLIIHGTNGKIQTEHTYGDDPYPPKG